MRDKFTGMLVAWDARPTAASILSIFDSVVESCHYSKGVQQ